MCCTPTRRHYQSYGDTRALAPSLELWTRSQSVVSPPTQLIDKARPQPPRGLLRVGLSSELTRLN